MPRRLTLASALTLAATAWLAAAGRPPVARAAALGFNVRIEIRAPVRLTSAGNAAAGTAGHTDAGRVTLANAPGAGPVSVRMLGPALSTAEVLPAGFALADGLAPDLEARTVTVLLQ
jgi:hypothetical protein